MKEMKAKVADMLKETNAKCEALEDRARKAERKNQDLLE